jgi:hypothetical protein
VKVLKACAVVAAAGFLLAGCGSEAQEDVRFKVTRITEPDDGRSPQVIMDLDQPKPESLNHLTKSEGAPIDRFPEGIKVGDTVICTVKQQDDNGLDGVDPKVTIGPCRSA